MRNTIVRSPRRASRGRRLPALLLLVPLALAAPVVSAAGTSPEISCRTGIQKEVSRWLARNLRARQRCLDHVIDGNGAIADCIGAENDPTLARSLESLDAQLKSALEKRCAGANFGLLSYPGPCTDPGGVFDPAAMATCIETIAGGALTDLMKTWYPASVDGLKLGAAANCLRSVPKRAAAMVFGELKARLRCLLDVERGQAGGVSDCRAQLVPYGPGTGSARLDDAVIAAQTAWMAGMPNACAAADFSSLGLAESCVPAVGTGLDLLDFHRCVFDSNRLEVPTLLDLAFPSAPVCGNGIPQEGEECDDGIFNSNSAPDACRLDCTLPFCGDHVTDPSNHEECDDGNSADLDGCTANCVLEVCGDGIENGNPHEECDDGNTDEHDSCTASCTLATCGDGVLCSAPDCTTGPGGGPEQCDEGAANSPTGFCHTDCSGFARSCTLTIGVTNTVNLGGLTYELLYGNAFGEIVGSGSTAQCTSLVTGGLTSFFDNDGTKTMRESVIKATGFQAPTSIAQCTFATNDAALQASAFSFNVVDSSDPDFNPVAATLAVTSLVCQSR